jgi:hypothetical protein
LKEMYICMHYILRERSWLYCRLEFQPARQISSDIPGFPQFAQQPLLCASFSNCYSLSSSHSMPHVLSYSQRMQNRQFTSSWKTGKGSGRLPLRWILER